MPVAGSSEELCVCAHVYVFMFFYPGGDLNLNAHRLMGNSVTVGT